MVKKNFAELESLVKNFDCNGTTRSCFYNKFYGVMLHDKFFKFDIFAHISNLTLLLLCLLFSIL